ncbi:MAG: 4Fe-4S binding protein, partial [Candidatus Aenigmarchaeota archaeon]|nr:4Fe-4S binding protein [Candidatus Aenigmarchaeota archaeon]
FVVRGSPEIPGIDKGQLESIRKELQDVDMQILDKGIDNLQSCFGDYCTETIADAQSLLKKVNKLVKDLDINNQKIKISGSGCPNACGIVHINDIGFHGAVEPVVEKSSCNGCGLCANVCKKKAIMIKDNLAIIDDEECKRCGHCISVCPTGAMKEGKKGFTVYLGGKEGKETRLGIVVDEFLSENEALELTKRCLTVLKEKNKNVSDIIDEVGLEKFKKMIK